MDSQHRHELEENALATWLTDKIEAVKPHAPAIVVGLIVLLAAWIGVNAWRASADAQRANRWGDYARAVDTGMPDLTLLRKAADDNPGTAVEQWSEITWADGNLYQAANLYFRDRDKADKAIEDAVGVYEELVKSTDPVIAGRAAFQLARAYEARGDLDEAREQYGRVTGAFAPLADERAERLASPEVVNAYEWITGTSTRTAAADSGEPIGDLKPDDLSLPEVTAEEAEATLDDLLEGVDTPAVPAEQAGSDDATPADDATLADDADAEPTADEAPTDTEQP